MNPPSRLLFFLFCVFFVCYRLEASESLVIVSPHWEGVQFEFGLAFEKYYKEKNGRAIHVRWRDVGGTSQIEKALDASYKANPDSCSIDIFFGGGMDPYENQKAKGHLLPHTLPVNLHKAMPTEVLGIHLADPDNTFYGAALSSFGIVENRKIVKKLSLPEVKTWEGLTDPRLFNWISSCDMRKSGSVHMIYEIILQAYGWEKGWSVILQMSGNVRSFMQSSSAPTKEVSVGDAAYAVSIDINGLTQQAHVGVENVRFIIPQGVSVIAPDGIAILKGAPNIDAAREFMNFVLSEKGQSLWMKPKGSMGGPVKFGISRMGVLPLLYGDGMKLALVPMNPFEPSSHAASFRYNSVLGSQRWHITNDLMGQTVIDVHSHLRKAWQSIHMLPANKRAPLIAAFSKPFITENEAAEFAHFWQKDKIRAARTANSWMTEAVGRYKSIGRQAEKMLEESKK